MIRTRFLAVALAVPAALVGHLVLVGGSSASPTSTPASFPSCGTYWNRNTPVSAKQRRVDACIVGASRTGRRARAVAALTTIEGDPIVNYLFVRGRRDVLVVVDSTRDRFGARTWERLWCTRLVVVDGHLGWAGCRTLGGGKPSWLRPIRLSG